jgi:methionyl-tRNA synthetase
VHGYLLLDDRKISKSLGNVIDPLDLIDVYGVDAVRFYVLREVSFGQDGSASIDGVRERYERELGNDLGNLLSRTTAMIARYRGGRLPMPSNSLALSHGGPVLEGAAVAARIDEFDLTGALELIWSHVRGLNGFVTETKPWELAKDEARLDDLDRVLYALVDGLRAAAIALAAYLPETAPRILRALGQPDDLSWDRAAPGRTDPATGIEATAPLFPRIELPEEVSPPPRPPTGSPTVA